MNIVDALSIAHSKRVAIGLKEWGGYWHFAEDGILRNADGSKVEPNRIAMYANRDNWHIWPISSDNDR